MDEKRVIIIDDSKYIIGMLEEFLCKKMHLNVVATACDGMNALDLYRKLKPDMVTLDLSMPKKGGKEVLGELMNEDPNANVLIVSAVRSKLLVECLLMGAKGYVEKPLRLHNTEYVADLVKTVNEVISGNVSQKTIDKEIRGRQE